jgi:uncharacterized membrane protein YkvA (DUF1232 family)
MSELDSKCLDVFPTWLESLPEDARALTELLVDPSLPASVRVQAAAALNYVVKSIDLIPEGVEDLGFIDDAFVLRVAAANAAPALTANEDEGAHAAPDSGDADERDRVPANGEQGTLEVAKATLRRLADEASLVQSFLGSDFPRLVHHASRLDHVTARGRSVEDIMNNPVTLNEFCREVRAWADSYEVPAFRADPKNLVKVRAFLSVKLAG